MRSAARGALEGLGQPDDFYGRGEAAGIDLLDGGGEQDIGARGGG